MKIMREKLLELIKEDIPFKNKYIYGKVLDDIIYVGVESSEEEARKSYNDLIKKYPNHKDYDNIDISTGGNETLNYIHTEILKNK